MLNQVFFKDKMEPNSPTWQDVLKLDIELGRNKQSLCYIHTQLDNNSIEDIYVVAINWLLISGEILIGIIQYSIFCVPQILYRTFLFG